MADIDIIQLFVIIIGICAVLLEMYHVLVLTLYGKYREWSNFRHFVRVFGISAKNNDNIKITMPEWHLVGEKNKDQIRFSKSLINPADKKFKKFHGPSVTIAYKDLDGVSHVAAVIYKSHPGLPINYNLDSVDEWDKREGKTMIMIGSIVANAHYRYLTQQDEVPYFEEYFTNKQMGYENPCYPAAVAF